MDLLGKNEFQEKTIWGEAGFGHNTSLPFLVEQQFPLKPKGVLRQTWRLMQWRHVFFSLDHLARELKCRCHVIRECLTTFTLQPSCLSCFLTVSRDSTKKLFSVLFSDYSEVELLDHLLILFLIFRNLHIIFFNSYTALYSHSQCRSMQFLHILTNIYLLK